MDRDWLVIYHCVGSVKPLNYDNVRVLTRHKKTSFSMKHKLRRLWHQILPDMDEHEGYGAMRYHGYFLDMVFTKQKSSCNYLTENDFMN